MATHARHSDSSRNGRVQIKFKRTDLLWEGGPITDPHTGRQETVPIILGSGIAAVGPTILDMLVREVVSLADVPDDAIPEEGEEAQANNEVAVWSVREPSTLWPRPGEPQRRSPRKEAGAEPEQYDHPFVAGLASGGKILDGGNGFILVEKLSTCSIAEGAFRLAVGMEGSVEAACDRVGRMAAKAWATDQKRALSLWKMVYAAGGLLVEDAAVAALRPASSISQEVERRLMREACLWLGVDPDVSVRRGRGRPKRIGDAGTETAADPHGILGLPPSASIEEATAAYLRITRAAAEAYRAIRMSLEAVKDAT